MGSVCFALIVMTPILIIFYTSIKVNFEVWTHIYNYLIFSYTINSLILLIGVAILTSLIGVLSAWFVVFYDIPFKKLLSILLVLPIAIPPYAMAYCYADMTDKYGIKNNILSLVF